jgi:hypothetical protein
MSCGLTPVLLLDVDGVINCFGSQGEIEWRPGDASAGRAKAAPPGWPTVRTWSLHWSADLTARLRALHESGSVEIRWATTWLHGDGVASVEQALGLPVFARAYPGDVHSHTRAKLTAAREVVASGRRLIWCDDDAIPAPWDGAREPFDAAGALLIVPSERSGLRPGHLDQIDRYLDGA